MKYAIGVDIGGTKIKIGMVRNDGKIIGFSSYKTPETKDKFNLLILRHIDKLIIKQKNILGIGLGVPGMIDLRSKKLIYLPHLNYLKNSRLTKLIKNHFNRECFIDNDAHCALNGQLFFILKNRYSTVVMLTLGTGTGSAIAINKRLFSGCDCSVAGLGEMIIKENGKKCTCGRLGCLNAYTGKYAIEKLAGLKFKKKIEIKELISLCDKNNRKAMEIFSEVGYFLGLGLANIISIFSPQLILISGGIANAWSFMKKEVFNTLKKNQFGDEKIKVTIKIVTNKNTSGVIGAASLVFQNLENH